MKRVLLILLFSLAGLTVCLAAGQSFVNDMTSGELSPFVKYRIDIKKRQSGLETATNFMVKQQGQAIRRPGTEFIGEVNDQNYPARMFPFEYSTTDAYILIFNKQAVSFYQTAEPNNEPRLYYYCHNPTTGNGRGAVTGVTKVCQTIALQNTHYITRFDTYWRREGSPDGTLYCRLETTVWDPTPGHWEPSGVVLETSPVTFDVALFPTGSPYKKCTFTFAGTTQLITGTTYAIVFYGSGFTQNPVYHYADWRGLNLAGPGTDGYTGGSSGYFSGMTWGYLDSAEDCWFEEYGTPYKAGQK